ncbi:hypothetical protein TWF694_006703 [Orbilia ellipsospora]|uniref:Rhodopsin domain-containing protein n=1 Tax=Orbilia ellipsospora TaxID=2528407 RepID=A0AAV9XKX3_9PEZI
MLSPPNPQTDADREYILSVSPIFREWPPDFQFPLVTIPGYKPPNNTLYSLVVSFIVVSIAASIVSMRFWVRFKARSTMGMDDYVMLPTFMIYFAFNVVNIYAVFATGFGFHIYDLSKEDIRSNLIVTYLHVIFSFAALHLCRISIQHLLLRLTPPQYSIRRRWYLYILITVSYLFALAAVLTQIFECGLPVAKAFDLRTALDGTCISLNSTVDYGIFMTGHIVLDCLTLFPPIFVLFRLPMSKKKKYNLIFLLVLGVITMVLSAIKPFYFYHKMVQSYDISWNATVVGFVGILELNLAITIASLPALNRYIMRFWKRVFGKRPQSPSRVESFAARFGVINFVRRDSAARRMPPKKSFLSSWTMSTTGTGTGVTTTTTAKDVSHSYIELGEVKSHETLQSTAPDDIEKNAADLHIAHARNNSIAGGTMSFRTIAEEDEHGEGGAGGEGEPEISNVRRGSRMSMPGTTVTVPPRARLSSI